MTRSAIARTSRRPRAQLAAFALLGALLVAACGTPPTPSPSPSASESATPSPAASPSAPSPSASEGACTGADLTVSAGPWGGAAGSRGSDIVVTNSGAAPCLLPASPTIAIIDPAGTVVLANTPPQAGAGPSLAPTTSIGFSLVIGNWCEESVDLPLRFSLALAAGAVEIGGLAVSSVDDLPPCNGPGQPPTLSTTAWEPA